jgi:uncharacterized protein YhjY with autotransporter beta-barrel domain
MVIVFNDYSIGKEIRAARRVHPSSIGDKELRCCFRASVAATLVAISTSAMADCSGNTYPTDNPYGCDGISVNATQKTFSTPITVNDSSSTNDTYGNYGLNQYWIAHNGVFLTGGASAPTPNDPGYPYSEDASGHGGSAGGATTNVVQGGDVTVTLTDPEHSDNIASPSNSPKVPWIAGGDAAVAIGGSGGNGAADYINGGDGGSAGESQLAVNVTDANVTVTNNTSMGGVPGILLYGKGGDGGLGGYKNDGSQANDNCSAICPGITGVIDSGGGAGGSAGNGDVNVTANKQNVVISTSGSGSSSPALADLQEGGSGGAGSPYEAPTHGYQAGAGGNGGNSGSESINLTGEINNSPGGTNYFVSLMTGEDYSPGIYASSIGGAGGNGGYEYSKYHDGLGGNGGSAGSGGDITINISIASINTVGQNSPGIDALSQGANGGIGGDGESIRANGGNGGEGGSSGNVTVGLDASSSVTTSGGYAAGIIAGSLSGAGGNGGGGFAFSKGVAGNGADGGVAGTVKVTNNGTITTSGDYSPGVVAQSIGGNGGAGGDSGGLFYAVAGSGDDGGNGNTVTIANLGTITTSGLFGNGVIAQSIGGSGGAGGSSNAGVVAIGGNYQSNPFGGSGGNVVLSGGGVISTTGSFADGVLAQSIGGGGGSGGNASSSGLGRVSIGGSGGGGGNGGALTITPNIATITTTGDNADGMVLQSIGGGGGNSGYGSTNGAGFFSVAIGGTCSGDGEINGVSIACKGGDGGPVTANLNQLTVKTSGSAATGILAQSVGGGGGNGGGAFASDIGLLFAASSAVGGNGGAGGKGGAVQITLDNSQITTGNDPRLTDPNNLQWNDSYNGCSSNNLSACQNSLPVNDYGVVVQSIGGGGGIAGSSDAKSTAIAIPVSKNFSVGVSISAAVGGTGGTGGDGGLAQFALSNGSSIKTYGSGATGVLIQSVGGGGGAGGDASASSTTYGPLFVPVPQQGIFKGVTVPDYLTQDITVNISAAIGGNGGGSGDGDEVDVALGGTIGSANNLVPDKSGSSSTSILTNGDYANGVTAQSIGGGGGDGGVGSANSQSFGSGYSYNVSVNVGGKGTSGGNGGAVNLSLFPESSITTFGSNALGILAQSIGGGGGASQASGATVVLTVPKSNTSNNDSVTVGEQGGAGGDGGPVKVLVDGQITTYGGDAEGLLAQSIGGGGGLGGSAGSDASADIPTDQRFENGLYDAQEGAKYLSGFISDLTESTFNPAKAVPFLGTATVSVGGKGGSGGSGGNVTVTLGTLNDSSLGGKSSRADVMTQGDWADGVDAQSIGDGGGKGGSANVQGTSTDPALTLNLDVAVGGGGGIGGIGGTTEIDANNAKINTSGFGAIGINAQSIGGGGGIGANGTFDGAGVLTVGGAKPAPGGTAMSGGDVTMNYEDFCITTQGAAADGIDLQSIGGGGGRGGAGSKFFIGTGQQTVQTKIVVGGDGSSGDGKSVTFQEVSINGTQPSKQSIATNGNDAFGLMAQSIGGGGGNATAQQTATSTSMKLGGGSGSGGSVTIDGDGELNISTTGVAAHGIVAQSIGGGGGIIRDVHLASDPTPGLLEMPGSERTGNTTPSGMGGPVTVSMMSGDSIDVTGNGSIGILAQSIGGGGGLVNNDLNGHILAGTVSGGCSGCTGSSNAVQVTTDGQVIASGENGIGIFAQSTGASVDPNNTSVNVSVNGNGTVKGGSGAAATVSSPGSAAIVIDTPSGANNNNVTLEAGGTITANDDPNGTAVLALGGGDVYVHNFGNIIGDCRGSITWSSKSNQGYGCIVDIGSTGMFTGAEVDGDLSNNGGTVNLVSPHTGAPMTATIAGNFTQTSDGRINVAIDSLNKTASQLVVNGTATIDGLIVPTAISLLPGRVPVITAANLDSGSLVNTFSSLLFHWDAERSDNSIYLSPTLNATPQGMALGANESALAGYLTKIWNAADPRFATQFAALSQLTSTGQYQTLLDAFTGKEIYGQAMSFVNSTRTMLGSSMSCPIFTDKATQLGEGSCAWAKTTGRSISEWGGADAEEGHSDDVTTRVGGQTEVAPNWYLGGSFGVDNSWSIADGGSSGNGQTYDGSIALKHTMGPWLFAGSLAVGGGTFQNDRTINLPAVSATLQSNPDVFLAGLRLRAGYELAFNNWYLRPYGDLDTVYTHLSGFQETGSALGALNVGGSGKTSVVLSPMVEIGGRWDLNNKTTLRPFAAIGASFRPEHTYTFDASFAGLLSGEGTFHDSFELPSAQMNLDLGVQLYSAGGFDMKAEYGLELGRGYRSQSGSLRIAHSF